MRRSHWSLLLPFLLLFAQQGAVRHELSHLAKPSLVCVKEAPAAQEHCSLCLAFAHFSGAAKTEIAPLAFVLDLAFALAPEPRVPAPNLATAAPRSRGPPAS
jgi:hypothetical protein